MKNVRTRIGKRYWERVKDKAAELGTDGCTGATGLFADCCLEHDIAYRLGTTLDGTPITKEQADKRFLCCMQSRSLWGWYSPMAWWRYAAVRVFGRPSSKSGGWACGIDS
mgnify:FL=1